jgi:TonB family protein
MKKLLGVLLVAFSLTVGTLASAAVVPPKEIVVRAYIALDATGKVTAIEWPHMDPKSTPLTNRLEKAVRSWAFEPGRLDGVPAATQTGLTLVVGASTGQRGALVLSILSARTGAVVDRRVFPRYPMDQAKRGATASITLLLDVDENGTVISASVQHYQAKRDKAKAREAFEAATRSAAMQWKFTPERVAGRGMPSRVEVPFDFCLGSGPCNPLRSDDAKIEKLRLPSGTAMALDSVVRIKTRTELVEI